MPTISGPRVLCALDALPPGDARGFDPDGEGNDTLFAVNLAGEVHAYRNRCPHDGTTPLPWRRHAYLNRARNRIVCSAHGAEFLIENGECVLGPCIGQFLSRVPLQVLDGHILIDPQERAS